MNIFYHQEHAKCSEYLSEIRLGFRYIEIEAGTAFSVDEKREKHLFFFLEGSAKVGYNEFPEKVFSVGEMIFLPKSADCYGMAITKCCFIVHIYDAPVKLCDRVGLDSIIGYAEHIQYEFKSLPICPTLQSYLLLLKSYLADGINCLHLHEIKQKELFLVLRAHYSKRDLALLFYPILGKALDFRSKVMTHHMDVKTVRELARLCGYSEGHFHELFVAEFGMPPYKWMQKQKAKHIIGRLAQGEISIKEIADEFNFSSQNHFNKYCKVQFGESAACVRQKMKL